MRSGFTLLEVLLASIILGAGLAAILVSMPLADVKDPDQDLDVRETKASALWDIVAGAHGPKLTREQEAKFHGYTWEREALNRQDSEEDIKRLGNLYTVRITVRWGNNRRGENEEESYVTFWRKKE